MLLDLKLFPEDQKTSAWASLVSFRQHIFICLNQIMTLRLISADSVLNQNRICRKMTSEFMLMFTCFCCPFVCVTQCTTRSFRLSSVLLFLSRVRRDQMPFIGVCCVTIYSRAINLIFINSKILKFKKNEKSALLFFSFGDSFQVELNQLDFLRVNFRATV